MGIVATEPRTSNQNPSAEGERAERPDLRPIPGFHGYLIAPNGDVYSARWRMFYRKGEPRKLAVKNPGGEKPVVILYRGEERVKLSVRKLVREVFGDTATESGPATANEAAETIVRLLELGDDRLLADDGPVGGQLPRLSPEEWGEVYRACKRIVRAAASVPSGGTKAGAAGR